ncbi:hypothetical protein SDC9_141766 [bioreactor metagenome]|uniref:Uncharacterized protein n=1 Tax=bioreactor metagenome TaxID=1076179 RepID=A0A645DZQ4_9ZZZZ
MKINHLYPVNLMTDKHIHYRLGQLLRFFKSRCVRQFLELSGNIHSHIQTCLMDFLPNRKNNDIFLSDVAMSMN